MNIVWKTILILLLVCIFISACVTFIPIEKYQQSYFNLIKKVRNKPIEHYEKQIEYAKYAEQYGEFPHELMKRKPITKQIPSDIKKTENAPLKPKYIRDKNNPEILHPYVERKFLFFRFYE